FNDAGAQTVLEDAGPQSVANWATNLSKGPPDESGQTLLGFTVSVLTNASLFSVQPGVTSAGTLIYTPAPDANGSATVKVTLKDNGGTANGGSDTSVDHIFTINVTPVNDAPTITVGPNPSVLEDAGAQTLSNWATITMGPANESGQSIL